MNTSKISGIAFFISIIFAVYSHGQTIKKAEYFFDIDPGVGNGIPIILASPSDSVNLNINIPVSTLGVGFHVLYLRVYGNTIIKNSSYLYANSFAGVPTITGVTTVSGGSWSTYERGSFYIKPSVVATTALGITIAEYFFDTDPGVGNGIPLSSFSTSDSINIIDNIPVSGLPVGFHELNIRTKDQRGIWSTYESRSFYVKQANVVTTSPGITEAEYFFDTDPGIGNGNLISNFSITDSINLVNNIPINWLTVGFHTLNIRTKDQRGIWSTYESRSFYIQPSVNTVTATGILTAEYFFDNDPGLGKGITLSIGTTSDSIALNNASIYTVSLTSGFHDLFIRTKNVQGLWSHYDGKRFYLQPSVSGLNYDPINYAEYFFNGNDPGNGKASPITLPYYADSINITAPIYAGINSVPLSFGVDTLYVRVRTSSGKYSMVLSKPFAVCQTAPLAKFGFDTVCVGSPTHFVNSTTGNNLLTTFAWDFENDGIVNSTFPGSVSYQYPNPGLYTAKLTVSNQGACFTTATGHVLVVASAPAQPSGIAGNINVCKGIQKYSIQSVPNTKYSWNTPSLGIIQLSPRKDTATVNWNNVGNDVLQVIPSNACGSGQAATLPVIVNNSLTLASAGSDQSICQGDSVVLYASGGANYLWVNQNITTSGIKVKPTSTTGYIVQVTQNNCSAFDTAFVIVYQTPLKPVITQSNDTLIITKIANANYKWYLGGLILGSSYRFVPPYSGTYNVKVSVGSCSPPLSDPFNFVKSGCTPQTIDFPSIPDKVITSLPFKISATASSGNPVTFQISSGNAVLTGADIVSITGLGIVSIAATVQGDETVCGVSLSKSFIVGTPSKRPQTINFGTLNNVYLDHPPITLSASAISGLPVKFTLISGPAVLINDVLTLSSVPGTVVLKASQDGDTTYNAAPDVVQTFSVFDYTQGVVRQPQTITFYPLANRTVESPPFILTGASTSGLKVNFVVLSGPAFIKGDSVFTNGKGKVKIKAYQSGNEFFYPADSVVQEFAVTDKGCDFLPASPVVTTNQPLCTGDDLIVKASNVPDAIYLWEGPDNFTSPNQYLTITGVSVAKAGNYKVTVSVGNCIAVPTYVRVNIYITPSKPTLTVLASNDCKGNTEISVPSIYGGYQWYLNNYKIANGISNSYSPGIKGSYSLRVFDSTKTCYTTSDAYSYDNLGSNTPPTISALNGETNLQSSEASSYQWYLDKRLIVDAKNQSINVLFNGNYKVLVSYADSCKFISSSFKVNKSTLKDVVREEAIFTDSTIVWAGIEENIIEVIPNPADNYFKITYKSSNSSKVNCSVLKANGSFVGDKPLTYNGFEHSVEFTTESWASGVYILKIYDGQIVKWAKVVIY